VSESLAERYGNADAEVTPEQEAAYLREQDMLRDADARERSANEQRVQDELNDELFAELTAAAAERRETNAQRGIAPGGSFYLDLPDQLPSIWGDDMAPLWVEGEGFMVTGPQGVGKTTIMQQLAHALAGLRADLLGWPVRPADGRVLYLAMDRPMQIARSGQRMVTERDRAALDAKMAVWRGPLPFSLTENPKALASWARDTIGATYIIADSYKDLAPDLSSESTGARINEAVQECLAEGIQWAGLHHNRKAQSDNKEPKELSDVYGSNWLTAGLGSVLGLWGAPGEALVKATHLKQPAESLGTFGIRHNHAAGSSTREDAPAKLSSTDERHFAILEAMAADPLAPWSSETVTSQFGVSQPTASRDLAALRKAGKIEKVNADAVTFQYLLIKGQV
jgi:hypothetical protein